MTQSKEGHGGRKDGVVTRRSHIGDMAGWKEKKQQVRARGRVLFEDFSD